MRVIPKIIAVGAVACMATTAFAADHRDGEAVKTDPSTDINDVFAFPADDNIILAMDVYPFAEDGAVFSEAAAYTFHVTSHSAFLMNDGTSSTVTCTFDAAQKPSCWISTDAGVQEYASGDASDEANPLVSDSGKLSVFAGLRTDPFYFYLTDGATPPAGGFNGARATTLAIAPTLAASNFHASGCIFGADVYANVTTKLVATSQSQNNFLNANVLALSLQIDKSLLTDDAHQLVSVWASTNMVQ